MDRIEVLKQKDIDLMYDQLDIPSALIQNQQYLVGTLQGSMQRTFELEQIRYKYQPTKK